VIARIRKLKHRFIKLVRHNKAARVLFDTGWKFYIDDGFTFAAGISFYFMLSFIPFMILLGAITGYVIEYVKEVQAISSADMVQYIYEYLKIAIPFLSEKYISGFVEISNYKTSLTTIGIISLFVSATLLFSTLHYCFYRIFGGKFVNFILSRLMGVVFLLTLTFILFFLHYLTTILSSITAFVVLHFPSVQWIVSTLTGGWIYSFILSTLIIVILFEVLIFYFTYGAGVSKRAIIIGALTFSMLWNGAKMIYDFYITELSSFSLFYGSATWIITSIFWVYYSSLILIICMEFIKALTKHVFTVKQDTLS